MIVFLEIVGVSSMSHVRRSRDNETPYSFSFCPHSSIVRDPVFFVLALRAMWTCSFITFSWTEQSSVSNSGKILYFTSPPPQSKVCVCARARMCVCVCLCMYFEIRIKSNGMRLKKKTAWKVKYFARKFIPILMTIDH